MSVLSFPTPLPPPSTSEELGVRLTQAWAKVWGRGSSAPQAPAAPSSGHPWERQVCKGLGLFQVPPYPGTTLPTHLPTVESARGSPTPPQECLPTHRLTQGTVRWEAASPSGTHPGLCYEGTSEGGAEGGPHPALSA